MRLIFLWVIWIPVFGFAQGNARDSTSGPLPFTLKITPLNLINPVQQSIDVLSDIPIAKQWAIEMGISRVVNSLVFAPYKDETYKGFKIKPALKYYFKRNAWGDDYFALAFKYNNIYNNRNVEVFRQGIQYREWLFQQRHLESWGAALRFGTQQYFGKHKRWFIEPYVGLGVVSIHVSQKALPPDAEIVNKVRVFNTNLVPGIYTTGDFLMGFSLGWAITAH